VAAVSLARRVAEETGTTLVRLPALNRSTTADVRTPSATQGELVGYSIRFEDVSSPATRLKFCTDGMLLREALLDPSLSKCERGCIAHRTAMSESGRRYSLVVIDEAHERTVHTDVLLGLLRRVLDARPEGFRLIVMSATLDADAFAGFFRGAHAVYVQGRQFPVQVRTADVLPLCVRYSLCATLQVMYTEAPEEDYLDAALLTVMQLHAEEAPGDVLVFLTGQEEIDAMARLLGERAAALPDGSAPLVIAPLYAALPPEQQMTVFEPVPVGVCYAFRARAPSRSLCECRLSQGDPCNKHR